MTPNRFLRVLVLTLLTCTIPASAQGPSKPLELKPGDHIAIIGSTLADRMQHTGHFEALLHARYPQHNLVIRNLAVAGDEISFRHRSENFGTPDEWLKKVQADVIFAFFGFNESFKGSEGLEKFKGDLDKFIAETLKKDYSGKGAPRLVLFSPVAAERHRDANFPDPGPINSNLTQYIAVMNEIAAKHGVQIVDLFAPSQKLYATAAGAGKSLTINGLHLGDEGDRLLATEMYRGLVSAAPPAGDLEKLRAAVNEKNAQWHARYRTVDGYNVYGGRSRLSYESPKGSPKISNFQVMQEEMAQRDQLTANRDKVVWAAAVGKTIAPDDSNLPPVTQVKTNKPGPNPDASHIFTKGEEAITQMKVHTGMKVKLFAAEDEFPQLINPVQMAWDTRGRLWVAVWPSYPSRTPTSKTGDALLIFEDTNGDGKADKCTPFIENLNCPTGFQFYKDGVLVMQAPDLWFVRDTNGDGKADWKERVIMGIDSADTHHTTNAMCYDPGGATYLSDGVFHRTQVETASGPVRNNDGAIYRFEPRTGRFERYIAYGFANPHGRVFDYWGNDLVTDATGNNTYFGPAISGSIDYPDKHKGIKRFWDRPARPCPGTGLLTSRHFPEEFQGNFLNINVIGFQGIYRVKVSEDGSGLKGETLEDLVSSKDPNFRPICVSTGPDGAIYFCDWHNAIIGHMQHHLRDPNRDKTHGRIYRVTYEGRPLLTPPKIHGQPIEALLDLLKEPENQTRELAKIELDKHDSAKVVAAVKLWIGRLNKSDPQYEHHMAEALWVHQWHNVVDVDLLKRVLRSPEPRARAAATRVLGYWRDQIPNALELLGPQAADEHPRVRLEAVRVASFFRSAAAAEVALRSKNHPSDYYLDYVLSESMRVLEPPLRRAIASGQSIGKDNPGLADYVMRKAPTAELMKMPRTAGVLETLLQRPDVTDAARNDCLTELSTLRKISRAKVVLELIESLAQREPGAVQYVARLLAQQPTADLVPLRPRIETLTNSKSPMARQAAWGALALADEGFDKLWPKARSTSAQTDLLTGISLIYAPDVRAKAYDRVKTMIAPGKQAGVLRGPAITALVAMQTEQEAIFASLADLIEKGEGIIDAARGIRALPRNSWDKARAGQLGKTLVAWAAKIPASQRTEQDYVETVQFASDLIGLLPPDEAGKLRTQLKELRVAVFVLTTVKEQMRYDTPRIVVEAGKPFEIILENTDFMQHNLVIVKPGARQAVGEAAGTMTPDQLDRAGRAFIPNSREILNATKLLEPGQRAVLKMTAPKTEGVYEYVCTYPGHWELMWGRLVVTKDVDKYLQENPDAAPPKAKKTMQHHQH